jgi:hypothetical protein
MSARSNSLAIPAYFEREALHSPRLASFAQRCSSGLLLQKLVRFWLPSARVSAMRRARCAGVVLRRFRVAFSRFRAQLRLVMALCVGDGAIKVRRTAVAPEIETQRWLKIASYDAHPRVGLATRARCARRVEPVSALRFSAARGGHYRFENPLPF